MLWGDSDHLGQLLMLQREDEIDFILYTQRLFDFRHYLIKQPLQTVFGRQTGKVGECLAVVENLLAEHPEHMPRKLSIRLYESKEPL